MPRRFNSRWSLIVVLSTAFLLAAVVFCLPKLQVPYHKWRMLASLEQHNSQQPQISDGFATINVGRARERYEYHRQQLVELGIVIERTYEFQHLVVPSEEAAHFTRFILGSEAPEHLDFSYPYPRRPELIQLTVWCYPELVEAWDDLVRTRDVADYRAQFMSAVGP